MADFNCIDVLGTGEPVVFDSVHRCDWVFDYSGVTLYGLCYFDQQCFYTCI